MSKKKTAKKDIASNVDEVASAEVEHLVSKAATALEGLLDDSPTQKLDFVQSEDIVADAVELSEESQMTAEFGEEIAIEAEPEVETQVVFEEAGADEVDVSGTELAEFSTAAIEVVEQLPEDRITSIVESLLFATDRPQSVAVLKTAFKGTNVRSHHVRSALDKLQIEYAGACRGVYLEEVAGGFQLRTKLDNMDFLKRTVKAKPFRLSGPALEVLAIVAYKQPMIKSQIDEIRGVESGHLLRALMEKNLVNFAGKSEFPGKPMLYGTTRRFLEIFGLRNVEELPSLTEIDQLIPEGIGDENDKETLSQVGDALAQEFANSTYSEGEDELQEIAADLEKVATTTDFFEEEKKRMKAQRDLEKAQDIRDALTLGETVSDSDKRWLARYDVAIAAAAAAPVVESASETAEAVSEIEPSV